MNEQEARLLLEKYRNGLCTDDERATIILWLENELQADPWELDQEGRIRLGLDIKHRIDAQLDAQPDTHTALELFAQRNAQPDNGPSQTTPNRLLKIFPIRRLTVAAAAILLIVGTAYLVISRLPRTTPAIDATLIQPGGNKAMLVLGDGSRIQLTGAKNGQLAAQGATQVIKSGDGTLTYQAPQNDPTDTVKYNTLITPRGGQYQLVLSDGSRVWLNAASSITFPANFSHTSRQVSISGEAYFEVAPDHRRPFTVTFSGQTVQVLGTRFDIKTYAEEQQTAATLIEGSVRVGKKDQTVLLQPGQTAISDKEDAALNVRAANVEKEIAWTRGEFAFVNDNIEVIMRQLSRWYDVDVTYEGATAGKDFSGSISRFSDVDKVLNTLQLTGIVHFKIQGRRIMAIVK
jgi:ferric-dicitrate binding protein FerR (iron transport regulator)